MRTLERCGARAAVLSLGLSLGLGLAAGCSTGGYVDGADLSGWVPWPPGSDLAGSDLGARSLELSLITPFAGPPVGGTPLRLGGSMFAEGATVQIGGSPATQVQLESPTALTAVSPPAGPGTKGLVPVTVRLPSGKSVTRADLFRYTSTALTLGAPTFHPVTSLPYALLTTDLNGDGVPDVVVTGSDLRVFLGKRDGTLQAAPGLGVAGTHSLAAGDLNRDGKTDVVFSADTATSGAKGVGVLLGKGDGTFQPVRYEIAAEGAVAVALADLNHDEKLDLLVGQYTSGTTDYVQVLLGKGDGTFEAPARIDVGDDPHQVTVVDLNRDGQLDLAVAVYGGMHGLILLGKGDGTFQMASKLPSLRRPIDLKAADLDGDGKLDLLLTAESTNLVTVHRGNGDGTFAPFTSVPLAPMGVSGSYRVTVADLNGDAVPDLAACLPSGGSALSVMLGNGDGTFRAPVEFPSGSSCFDVAAPDLNGDGLADVVLTNVAGTAKLAALLNTTGKP